MFEPFFENETNETDKNNKNNKNEKLTVSPVSPSFSSPISPPNKTTPTKSLMKGPSSPTSVQKLGMDIANWRFLYDILIMEIELSKDDEDDSDYDNDDIEINELNLAGIISEAFRNSDSLLKQLEKDLGVSCCDGKYIENIFLDAQNKNKENTDNKFSFDIFMEHVEKIKSEHISNKPHPIKNIYNVIFKQILPQLEKSSTFITFLIFSIELLLEWSIALILASYLFYLSIFIKLNIVSPSYRVYIITMFFPKNSNLKEEEKKNSTDVGETSEESIMTPLSPLSLLISHIEVLCDNIDDILYEYSIMNSSQNQDQSTSSFSYKHKIIFHTFSFLNFIFTLIPFTYILSDIFLNQDNTSSHQSSSVGSTSQVQDTLFNTNINTPVVTPVNSGGGIGHLLATDGGTTSREHVFDDNLEEAVDRSLTDSYMFSRSPTQ